MEDSSSKKVENSWVAPGGGDSPTARLGDSLLEQEALAALREVAFAVQSVSLSESLPLTSELVFMNLTTLEGFKFCVELTQRGWRVTSAQHDSMTGDYRRLDLHTQYFETIYQLLNSISPEFRTRFANKVGEKLNFLINENVLYFAGNYTLYLIHPLPDLPHHAHLLHLFNRFLAMYPLYHDEHSAGVPYFRRFRF